MLREPWLSPLFDLWREVGGDRAKLDANKLRPWVWSAFDVIEDARAVAEEDERAAQETDG